ARGIDDRAAGDARRPLTVWLREDRYQDVIPVTGRTRASSLLSTITGSPFSKGERSGRSIDHTARRGPDTRTDCPEGCWDGAPAASFRPTKWPRAGNQPIAGRRR